MELHLYFEIRNILYRTYNDFAVNSIIEASLFIVYEYYSVYYANKKMLFSAGFKCRITYIYVSTFPKLVPSANLTYLFRSLCSF